MAAMAILERSTTSEAFFQGKAPLGAERTCATGAAVGNDVRQAARVSVLAQVPFFASLGEQELKDLAAACQARSYRPDQALFYEGDPGTALYLVLSGQVKILRDSPDGQETILNVLGPGEYFGEMALVDDEPRSATAEALGRVEVLILHRDEFLALVERRPAVARAVMAGLARMVRRVTEQLQDAFLLDVPGRIARRLLELAERHGQVTPRGIWIPLAMTREEFAQMVGATRQTASSELCRFQERGILTVEREGITLHRPEQLRQRIY